MKKLIIFLVSLCLVSSCCLFTKINHNNDNTETTEIVYGYSQMRYTMNKVLGISQVDSMIVVDKLTPLEDWLVVPIGRNQYEYINQYMYIKYLEDDHELIYTATQIDRDTLYKCTKRIIEKIVEE